MLLVQVYGSYKPSVLKAYISDPFYHVQEVASMRPLLSNGSTLLLQRTNSWRYQLTSII